MSVPRVAALLGQPLDRADLAAWQRLVAASTAEAFDLDFKKAHYVKALELEFAKDIAAFANTQGGVIVIGVEEVNKVAAALNPVVFDEDLEQQMERWVANNVFPRPAWRSHRVHDPADSTKGLLLCIVPQSRLAPHALYLPGDRTDPTLRYPTRRNADTFYLAEHEVAERYRQRFVRGQESETRFTALAKEGSMSWSWSDTPAHIEVVLLPLEPGELRLTQALVDERQQQQMRLPSDHCLHGARLSIGFRRIRARDPKADAVRAARFYAEFRSDGSGYAAAALGIRGAEERLVTQSDMLCIASELLDRLSTHAVLAGAVGDARLSLQLVFAPGPALPRLRPICDPYFVVWHQLPVATGPFRSELTVPLLRSPTDSMLVLRSVLTDWNQGFGVAESDLIETDGTIDAGRWNVVAGEDPESTIRRRGSFPREVIRR